MPRLPQAPIERRSLPASISYPAITGETAETFGSGAFRALSETAQIFAGIQDTSDKMAATRAALTAAAAIDGSLKINDQQIPDDNEFYAKTAEDTRTHYQTALESLSTPKAKQLYQNAMADNLVKARTELEIIRHKKTGQKVLGDLELSRKQMVDGIARSEDFDERKALVEGYGYLLGLAQKRNFITAEKAEEESRKFLKDADVARAGYLMEISPERLKATLNDKNFPHLSATERYQWDQRANEVIRERELRVTQEQKKIVDGLNRDMLVASEASQADLTKLREKVLARTDMPFETQKFWVDRLNKMIEEKLHPKHIVDPFRTSDSPTLARVMHGVMTEPEKWTVEGVLGLMGNGLSVSHAMQAANMLQRAEKDPAGTLTPLKMAQQTWGQLQSQLAFVPPDERIKNAPEALVKNNREAQRIWDEVVRREAAGQDPRIVLDELMQPHYDSAIKRWYDPRSFFQGSMTREEEVEARQLLTRRRQPVTEANIQTTVEAIRKNKAAVPQGFTPVPLAPNADANQLKRLRDQEARINQLQKELIEMKTKK